VPRHIVCLTFDFDTQSGFIARGMTSATALSRGEFGLVGAQRILTLLTAYGMRATWFVPGFTIESHPRACEAVVRDGHEVAHHSWAHIPPAQQTRAEEEADLVRANDAIAALTGRKARGYRSPSWDLSENTIDLLLAHGFLYDSSLMGADYWPYRARRGDQAELGEPYRFGEETALIEMPISWSLDDYPHFEFVRTPATVLPGLHSARTVMETWRDEFRYMQQKWIGLIHPVRSAVRLRMLALKDCEGFSAADAFARPQRTTKAEVPASEAAAGGQRPARPGPGKPARAARASRNRRGGTHHESAVSNGNAIPNPLIGAVF
jgi:peptidoglycan/xylan/chitin deacetylase (PgdA/CDA1 family)